MPRVAPPSTFTKPISHTCRGRWNSTVITPSHHAGRGTRRTRTADHMISRNGDMKGIEPTRVYEWIEHKGRLFGCNWVGSKRRFSRVKRHFRLL